MKFGDRARSFFGATIPALILCVVTSEIVFRTLIPSCQVPYVYFDHQSQIMRFDPDARAQGTFTIGALAVHRSSWKVNDHGWISDVDYGPLRESTLPLVAIVGDSYIEGLQVDVSENVASVLRSNLAGEADVLSVGISGAPLSQYLHLVRYVVRKYDPEAIVLNVVHNDLTESIRSIEAKRGSLQLEVGDAGVRELPIVPYHPSRFMRLMRNSALVRYLWSNLKVQSIPRRTRPIGRPQRYAGNVAIDPSIPRRSDVGVATRYAFDSIRAAAGNRCVIVTMNALRDDVLGSKTGDSLALWMSDMVEDAALATGASYVDFTGPFRRLYSERGERFCFAYDAHWNAAGHRAAALAMEASLRHSLLALKTN